MASNFIDKATGDPTLPIRECSSEGVTIPAAGTRLSILFESAPKRATFLDTLSIAVEEVVIGCHMRGPERRHRRGFVPPLEYQARSRRPDSFQRPSAEWRLAMQLLTD